MGNRSLRYRACVGLCSFAVLPGCGSSDDGRPSQPDAAKPFDAVAGPDQAIHPVESDAPAPKTDAPIQPDAPIQTPDAPIQGIDVPVQTVDAPIQALDAPSEVDGPARLDGHYFSYPDGRQLLQVDYCLPILPLADGSRYCPATLDEAKAIARDALDGGALDAAPWETGRPQLSQPCVEPLGIFLPNGPSLGWGVACYYDANSGQLLSIVAGSDTTTECTRSPIPNTAAFVAQVYGLYPTCTWPGADGGG
jgi:hypothetical protein